MSLICELGWHKGDRLAPWNNGYYFSKCRRCRRDIVKGSTGGWFAPKGFRVVWQGAAPEHRRHAALAEERRPDDVSALPPAAAAVTAAAATAAAAIPSEPPATPPPLPEEALPEAPAAAPGDTSAPAMPPAAAEAAAEAPAPIPSAPAAPPPAAAMRNELPIQEVLRHLEQDAPRTAHTVTEAPVPPPEAAPPLQPAATAGDDFDFDDFFLEEERDEKSWQLAVQPVPPEAATPAAEAAPAPAAPAPAAPSAEHPAKPRVDVSAPTSDAAPKRSYEVPAVVGGTLSLAALTAGLLAYLFTPSAEGPADPAGNTISNLVTEAQPAEEAFASPTTDAGTSEEDDITPSVEAALPEPAERESSTLKAPAPVGSALVTASIINCRSNASEAAPTIRKMVKGARVDVLASQAGWVNVSYRGKQCWIADRYLNEK